MKPISVIGAASYLPENVVTNEFFGSLDGGKRKGLFTPPTERRHVAPREMASEMIERAARQLVDDLNLVPARDIDILLTNVAVPDEAFTGCGAVVAERLGCHPRWIFDIHNSGCVAFVYMLELARSLLQSTDAKSALLCNVQNAGGRVFANPDVRNRPQAPIPGDGCGVGYVVASAQSPVLSLVHRSFPPYAADMSCVSDDGRLYWEPGTSPFCVNFNESRVASVIQRGNRLVPEIILEACKQARVMPSEIGTMITNQPSPIFLRNWREAVGVSKETHVDTYDRYGNLFGAAIPINLDHAIRDGRLRRDDIVVLGGFSHAGDYSAAAVIRWQPT